MTAVVALKNIEIIESEGLAENARSVGAHLLEGLTDLADEHPIIGNVRGIGLLLGIELVADRDTRARFPKETRLAKRLTTAFQEGLILRSDDDRVP